MKSIQGCFGPLMSALGQERTLKRLYTMSALPPKADIRQGNRDVRFVPKADVKGVCGGITVEPSFASKGCRTTLVGPPP